MSNRKATDYFIHAPNKHGRRSFAIIERRGKVNKVLKRSDIDAINAKFKDGTLDFDVALALVERVKDALYEAKKIDKFIHKDNVQLLKDYWEKRYEYKDIKAKDSAYDRLRRAIEAIEELSLFVATQHQLQAKLSKHPQQRAIASALNQMLKYINRYDIRLTKNKKGPNNPEHLTPQELDKVLPYVKCTRPELFKLLCRVAIGTGMRVGEIFAITHNSYRENNRALFVREQMQRDGTYDTTKTRNDRTTLILPDYKNDITRWINDVTMSDKLKIRNLAHAKILSEACRKAFPDDTKKHCVFHDLRHSYAIELVKLGFNDIEVAQCLGNDPAVCREYYIGFSSTRENLKVAADKLDRQHASKH